MRRASLLAIGLLAASLGSSMEVRAQGATDAASVIKGARATVTTLRQLSEQGTFQDASPVTVLAMTTPVCRMPAYEPPASYRASPLPVVKSPPERVERMPVAQPLCGATQLSQKYVPLCAVPPDSTGACRAREAP